MVLFELSTVQTRVRSVVSSALLSERIASAHISILRCSSILRSRTRKCETTRDATLSTTASVTSTIFTCRILFIHCILLNNEKGSFLIAF